jgi:hypothetical protein
MKKFELTSETKINIFGKKLFRIKALISFAVITAAKSCLPDPPHCQNGRNVEKLPISAAQMIFFKLFTDTSQNPRKVARYQCGCCYNPCCKPFP